MSVIFDVKYSSSNEYEEPVTEALFQFLVAPCSNYDQTLVDFSINHSLGKDFFWTRNSFGFETIRVRSGKLIKEFNFSFTSRVEKRETKIPDNFTLRQDEQYEMLGSYDFYLNTYLYLSKTPLTKISYSKRDVFLSLDKSISLIEFCTKLNTYTHKLLTYTPNATNVETSADDALLLGKGVCQDYTHIFISIARELGIPARYVSGYLDQGSKFFGNAMMHAWAEVFIPGWGWVGFDPTNNIKVNWQYIKVCHGVDYADCGPLKGVLMTNGINKTSHSVEVAQ